MYIEERMDGWTPPTLHVVSLLKHEPRIYSMSAGSPRECPSLRWFVGVAGRWCWRAVIVGGGGDASFDHVSGAEVQLTRKTGYRRAVWL